jgi:hypothetical protein
MNTHLPDYIAEQLKQPFGQILSTENFGEVVNDIAELIFHGQLTREKVENLLNEYGIKNYDKIKNGILNLILSYITWVLQDNYITTKEADSVKFLKQFFKIKEGDFYQTRFHEVERILDKQLEHMYQDDTIIIEEALQKVELQQLFDLSYDQFLELSNKAVKNALSRGADPSDLDTFVKLY